MAHDRSKEELKLAYIAWELRTILAFETREHVLQNFLPQGWSVAPTPAGVSKGANFRLGLSDQLLIEKVEDRIEQEPERFVPLVISAIHPSLSAPVSMPPVVLSTKETEVRFSYPEEGEVDVRRTPDIVEVERSVRTDRTGKATVIERWDFEGNNGERITVHLDFVRAKPTKGKMELLVFPPRPGADLHRTYHIENVEEVVYSLPSGIDLRREYHLTASGPILSKLFDGSEKLVSIVSQPMNRRKVHLA